MGSINENRKEHFSGNLTYRFEVGSPSEEEEEAIGESTIIRMIMFSGEPVSNDVASGNFDTAKLPRLTEALIEHALSRFLEARGMTIKRNRFERLALHQVDVVAGQLVQLHSGISFRARRPFQDQPYGFTLSVQWVARATFAHTLENDVLRAISPNLAVLYTPKDSPMAELADYENHYVGRVKEVANSTQLILGCKDNALRNVPACDLTLEASPEAIRRYELYTGSTQQRTRIWRQLQQLSQVVTPEGRRNTAVLRHRLDAIRGVLGGPSKEQLIIPLEALQTGTVSIGLLPLRVEMSA